MAWSCSWINQHILTLSNSLTCISSSFVSSPTCRLFPVLSLSTSFCLIIDSRTTEIETQIGWFHFLNTIEICYLVALASKIFFITKHVKILYNAPVGHRKRQKQCTHLSKASWFVWKCITHKILLQTVSLIFATSKDCLLWFIVNCNLNKIHGQYRVSLLEIVF